MSTIRGTFYKSGGFTDEYGQEYDPDVVEMLTSRGDTFEGEYNDSGNYCTRCKCYLNDEDITDGRCDFCEGELI